MEWYNKVKSFLGIPEAPKPTHFEEHERYWPSENQPSTNFNIFTDPLEMHRYFEEQMSEMLRNFGFYEFSNNFDNIPQIEEVPDDPRDLRDQFLKPGYESKQDVELKDQDLDGKLDIRDWGSVFKGENSALPKSQFFGQSISSRTIRNSDGSIETHHTVRDNEGNEETTISRKFGDKEYIVVTKRDREGKEEVIENLINLDEKELDSFFPNQSKNLPQLDQQPWQFYDNFFK